MKVLLTGGTGFVGTPLLRALNSAGHEVILALRSCVDEPPECAGLFYYPGLEFDVDWAFGLADVEVVVHVAARAHVLASEGNEGLSLFHKINVDGTLSLARQAADRGVKRFVFISSIKAMGESTEIGQPYCAEGKLQASDPYGLSKKAAEEGLSALCADTEMELVIIRPVLVYGPGVGANFLKMMQWTRRGIPLPFGAVRNKRSFVSVDNLVDLLVVCTAHPLAANRVFLLSDGEDLSTGDLLLRVASAMGKSSRLISVPVFFLRMIAHCVGQDALFQRLCGSLQVDMQQTCEVLGWRPPVSVDTALAQTVNYYREIN